MKMITEVLEPSPETAIYNALHFAFYSGYLTRSETIDAFVKLSEDFPAHRFNEFHSSWRMRHNVT